MLRVHCFGYTFTPKLLPSLFVFVFFPLLISLGFWQLHRADYKKSLESQFQSRLKPTLTLQDLKNTPQKVWQYRRIKLTGHFDTHHSILIDNQFWHHHVGYHVLTPFMTLQGNTILVNRGWIPSTGNRSKLPVIPHYPGPITIEGLLKIPKSVFLLSHQLKTGSWPLLAEGLDFKKIKKVYNKPLDAFIVLLSPQSPGGFQRDWHPVIINPARHIGYAIQWFALALALVIIYASLCTKKRGTDAAPKKN